MTDVLDSINREQFKHPADNAMHEQLTEEAMHEQFTEEVRHEQFTEEVRHDDNMKGRIKQAKHDYTFLGGYEAFKSGEWLHALIQRSFKNYWERANYEYFRQKYRDRDTQDIAKRLIEIAAKNAALLGGITGAAISADEIVAIVTAGAGIGLPANIAVGLASLSLEAIMLVHLQLQLIANLGKLYGVPLDPDDPEDILTILAFAIGGGAADAAGKAGMKVGGKAAGRVAKLIFAGDRLKLAKRVGAKIGVKILQRSIVKYTIPIVSTGIGLVWNYFATKAVGRIAMKHFQTRS
jgi:uncharacterized protein (DUF697 family)